MLTTKHLILSIAFTAMVIHVTATPETDYIDSQLARIQSEFNVHVHYQYDTNLFFPPEWKRPALELAAREINTAEVTRLLPILQQFLTAHPAAVVQAELEHIYLLQEMSFQGKPYGGTHRARSMYIVCNGIENRFTTDFMLCRLHSEFSSILFDHHDFPTNSWEQLNPVNFTYSGNGFEVVDHPSRYDISDRSCAEGFLVNYSKSSLENDFNIISSWLFTKRAELDEKANLHRTIEMKRTLATEFYLSLSGQYNFN